MQANLVSFSSNVMHQEANREIINIVQDMKELIHGSSEQSCLDKSRPKHQYFSGINVQERENRFQ